MPWNPRNKRYTTTPSRKEVNIRQIPLLPKDGWRLCDLEEFPIVGTVPKNYLAYGNPALPGTRGYFAKKGRLKNDARECVTEEIISKIGAMLPLEMAESKLVRITKSDVRFLSQNFVERGKHELLHGIELAARYLGTDQSELEAVFDLKNREAEQNFYTIENMVTIFEDLYPMYCDALKSGFFKMIAFDAFIGAPDRHAMNWGVLVPMEAGSVPIRYSPIFDTARGLFREHSDGDLEEKQKTKGRSQFLQDYAEKSRPIFGTRQGIRENHFSLVEWIIQNRLDEDCKSMCTVIDSVDMSRIGTMLQRRFRRIITQERIRFIEDLLSYRISRLREVVRK